MRSKLQVLIYNERIAYSNWMRVSDIQDENVFEHYSNELEVACKALDEYAAQLTLAVKDAEKAVERLVDTSGGVCS